jgi:hypothetical protein
VTASAEPLAPLADGDVDDAALAGLATELPADSAPGLLPLSNRVVVSVVSVLKWLCPGDASCVVVVVKVVARAPPSAAGASCRGPSWSTSVISWS